MEKDFIIENQYGFNEILKVSFGVLRVDRYGQVLFSALALSVVNCFPKRSDDGFKPGFEPI
jgi:hypothetical protein